MGYIGIGIFVGVDIKLDDDFGIFAWQARRRSYIAEVTICNLRQAGGLSLSSSTSSLSIELSPSCIFSFLYCSL